MTALDLLDELEAVILRLCHCMGVDGHTADCPVGADVRAARGEVTSDGE